MPKVGTAMILGLVILGIALFIPSMIDATQSDSVTTVQLADGETANVTEVLQIEASNISNGQSEANITVRNTRTFNDSQKLHNVSETKSHTVDGDTVDTTLDSIDSSNVATITVNYSPMFGWDRGPKVFFKNTPIILSLVGFLLLMGILIVVVRA